MRQIVLDTETTGLEPGQDHRIIEIGCVELLERKLTGNHFHHYLNPERAVDAGALDVHGISNEFLQDKPVFSDIVDDFLAYVQGAELIIHNAAFDIGFLDHELARMEPSRSPARKMADYCTVLDTLVLARQMHPGQRNSLDALCKRYQVDNSRRDVHGALLDSEILAEVYLLMTGGQTSLALADDDPSGSTSADGIRRVELQPGSLRIIPANEQELAAHEARLKEIDAVSDGCVWHTLNNS